MPRVQPLLAILCFLAGITHSFARDTVVDDGGTTIALERPAQRIVTLAPHATEWLFSTGAGDLVVGTVQHSNFPEPARKITRIGNASRIDLEALVVIKPDLVIGWLSGNRARTIERIRELGIPVYLSEARSMQDIPRHLRAMGVLTGRTQSAEAAATRFEADMRMLMDRFNEKTPVSVFYQLWDQPVMTVGGPHLISEIITLCGGNNVFASLNSLTATVGIESVLQAMPQTIIAAIETHRDPFKPWYSYTAIPAVAEHHLFTVQASLIHQPTSRILEGMAAICRHLDSVRAPPGQPD